MKQNMELDELKNSWNALNKRLDNSEVVNMRVVREMISQKTSSAFDRLFNQNLRSFAVSVVILAVVFPWVCMNTPISKTSFVIVEAAMAIGLISQIWKLTLLSKFDIEGKKCNELCRLVLRYKQIRQSESLWGIALVALTFVAFYVSEICFNDAVTYVFGPKILQVVGMTLLTFALAYVIGLWQLRRHAQQMQEIESGLQELQEFENNK
jgi:protein-S-isoprenylcysteine O-methyltransferase Ste14